MPQYRRRTRSRSRSRGKKTHRRRHISSESSGSSYSRSRSRSQEKRYHTKERARRTPPKFRRGPAHTPSDRKRHNYDDRSHSASLSPRPQRAHPKLEAQQNFPMDTSKVLSGNFSEIPGLDFIGRAGNERTKDDRSFSPQHSRSSQDLDMRLRELESQQNPGGQRPRSASARSKNEPRDYFDVKPPSPERYRQRSASPVDSSRFSSKEQGMSSEKSRYREQQRPDYGIRVEVKRKQHSPRRRKLDPALVVIPRRKDEGLRPLFDRPEIIIRTLEDDPELYPEKYDPYSCWRKPPESPPGIDGRDGHGRSRKHSRQHKEQARSPSPDVPRETTVVMKPFTIYEKYEQSLRNRPEILQEADNISRFDPPHSQEYNLPQSSLSAMTPPLAMDNLLATNSDLRRDLDIRRHILSESRSPTRPLASALPQDGEDVVSDRRPVRERLGEIDGGGVKAEGSIPDFRKEVEELQKMDPNLDFKGKFYQHDDRESTSPPFQRRDERRYERGRFVVRGNYRGHNFRANFRGNNFRGNNFRGGYNRGYNRGFRGNYRGGFSRPYNRGSGNASSWKHDKFEEKDREREREREREERRQKKEKKEKKEKKKSKKSKKSPDRAKSKKKSVE